MSFKEDFAEPQYFSERMIVISAEQYSKEEAVEIINEYCCEEIVPGDLYEDRVRYGFTPESVDIDSPHCWWTGASGKGSKRVWVYEY
jgi:hypothetical protein